MFEQIELALRESAHRAMVTLAALLPGIFALLAAFVLIALLGALAAAILRRLLLLLRFDEWMAHNTVVPLSDWSPRHSPVLLVTRGVFLASVILGLIIGVLAFDSAGNLHLANLLLPSITHTVGAILVLVLGVLIARFLARSVLIGAVNLNLQYARLLSLGVKWMVLVITAAMVLDHLQVGGLIVDLAFGILFGGIVLTMALAVGLGSREMVTRSLEKNVEHPFDSVPETSARTRRETLRHF